MRVALKEIIYYGKENFILYIKWNQARDPGGFFRFVQQLQREKYGNLQKIWENEELLTVLGTFLKSGKVRMTK